MERMVRFPEFRLDRPARRRCDPFAEALPRLYLQWHVHLHLQWHVHLLRFVIEPTSVDQIPLSAVIPMYVTTAMTGWAADADAARFLRVGDRANRARLRTFLAYGILLE